MPLNVWKREILYDKNIRRQSLPAENFVDFCDQKDHKCVYNGERPYH